MRRKKKKKARREGRRLCRSSSIKVGRESDRFSIKDCCLIKKKYILDYYLLQVEV